MPYPAAPRAPTTSLLGPGPRASRRSPRPPPPRIRAARPPTALTSRPRANRAAPNIASVPFAPRSVRRPTGAGEYGPCLRECVESPLRARARARARFPSWDLRRNARSSTSKSRSTSTTRFGVRAPSLSRWERAGVRENSRRHPMQQCEPPASCSCRLPTSASSVPTADWPSELDDALLPQLQRLLQHLHHLRRVPAADVGAM